MIKNKRLLFVLKKRSGYGVSYGLANSCKFICNTLSNYNIQCKVVEVTDNNCIDKEVHDFKPTHVFIDALWVVPEKFKTLLPRYPNIKWAVRIHSKIPFLSMEGIALQWLWGYQKELVENYDNFIITANAYKTSFQLCDLGIESKYFPNMYDPQFDVLEEGAGSRNTHILDIGCFGSIRPLKNHLQQATAAIIFANSVGKKMKFHVNANRVEQHGEPILKNLEHLFSNSTHELVKHDWMNHEKFIQLVRKMELGLQVSYSESFNIVAADFVSQDIPLIGSPDIEWLSKHYQADPNDYQDIVQKLQDAYTYKKMGVHWINKYRLWKHNREATEKWLDYLIGEDVVK